MKHLHRCPKCAGRRIRIIEKYRIPGGDTVAGTELSVLPHVPDAGASRFSFQKINPIGHFDLYLCDGCGYAELWAEGFKQKLVEDPARGVRLMDTTDATEGPFR